MEAWKNGSHRQFLPGTMLRSEQLSTPAASKNMHMVTFWHGSGSADPYHLLLIWIPIFSLMVFKMTPKFSPKFFLPITVGTFTSDNKLSRSHKTEEIKGFINFFAGWWKDPDPYRLIVTDPGSGSLARIVLYSNNRHPTNQRKAPHLGHFFRVTVPSLWGGTGPLL